MFKWKNAPLFLVGLALVAPSLAQAQPATRASQPNEPATWISPHNNVKVETGDCGGKLCGWAVWATPEAKQDARDGGTPNLVGTKLLEDYRETAPGKWEGHVFVPDMGRTFYSTISQLDPNTLKISGCIMGGLICKSQIWHKV